MGLCRDLDQTRDWKIKILSTLLKPVVRSFRLPPRPFRCGHWFSSYRLETFTLPQPAIRRWRNTPATAGLSYWKMTLTNVDVIEIGILVVNYSAATLACPLPGWSCNEGKTQRSSNIRIFSSRDRQTSLVRAVKHAYIHLNPSCNGLHTHKYLGKFH